MVHTATQGKLARVLLVDDEENVTSSLKLALRKDPFQVECTASAREALQMLENQSFDLIISDEQMPEMSGSQLLGVVREKYPDIVRIILSGHANLDAAIQSINNAEIYRFLLKPCSSERIRKTIMEGLEMRREKMQSMPSMEVEGNGEPDRLAQAFSRDLSTVWLGFQPIVRVQTNSPYGYEALLRSSDPDWWGAPRFFSIAKRLGRSKEAGRHIRTMAAHSMEFAPPNTALFVNVNPGDLEDKSLTDGTDELAEYARRVVLEITEREPLNLVPDLDKKLKSLRSIGYHIAVDDLGAGYSGLSSLAAILPDVVKFDLDLVHGIDRSTTKQKLVEALARMCCDLGIETLAEGVETRGELEMVISLGCNLVQGYYIGHASRTFEVGGIPDKG